MHAVQLRFNDNGDYAGLDGDQPLATQDGKARIVTVDLTEPTDGDDKICGGMMDVFVERLG